MDVRRTLRLAVAIVVTGAALGIVWGLSVSVVMSEPAIKRSELPDAETTGDDGSRELVVSAPYGDGDCDVGIAFDGETRGPSSVGVDDRGRVWILDAVNRRVLRFDEGRCAQSIALPSDGFEDLVVARDKVCVLERNDERRVLVFDDAGDRRTLPIEDDVPPVYRLFVVGTDIVVECPRADGREYYTVGRLDGSPLGRQDKDTPCTAGTPVPAGGVLKVETRSGNDVAVDVMDSQSRALARLRLHSARQVAAILDATTDRKGNVYLAWALADEGGSRMAVTKYSPDGELVGRIETSRDEYAEPFRRFTLSESGELYQLENTKGGMRVFRWTLAP